MNLKNNPNQKYEFFGCDLKYGFNIDTLKEIVGGVTFHN